MKIKQLIHEDFLNYKKGSMIIGFPTCTFKCEKECGIEGMCQNSTLAKEQDIDISYDYIIEKYLQNPFTNAFCYMGLEPMDSFEDVYELTRRIRKNDIKDDIVIYTGYYEYEIQDKLEKLEEFKNIIIKFGRYIPNRKSRYDNVLGITLASDNQYARKIS